MHVPLAPPSCPPPPKRHTHTNAHTPTNHTDRYPKPPLRTRKWLHLDDLTGSGVFRQQMTLVRGAARVWCHPP
jgi:hypothetical protein